MKTSSSTFIEREERRWLTWYNRKVRAQAMASARRWALAGGSVSAWIRPVRTARPTDAVMAARCANVRLAQPDVAPVPTPTRDLELAQLILEQTQDMTGTHNLTADSRGYLHTDSEPVSQGLYPWGDLSDEQTWLVNAMSSVPLSPTDHRRAGFVGWDTKK